MATVLSATIQAVLQVIVEKAIYLATEEFSLLWGFNEDLARLERSLTMLQAFLYDAERQQVNGQAIKVWLQNLEIVVYDADNILDELNYEILRHKIEIRNLMRRKVCCFFSLSSHFSFRSRMAHKVRELLMNLERNNSEATGYGLQLQRVAAYSVGLPLSNVRPIRQTDSMTVDPTVVGRNEDATKIIEMLLKPSDEFLSVIPIVGMGGIGKTTLARKIFNDQQIQGQFKKRIWVCVSLNFDATRLLDMILESLTGKRAKGDSRECKVKKLQRVLQGKKYLLVLDDMWNENFVLWNDFLGSLKGTSTTKGNFIVVTTRGQQVASMVGTIQPCFMKKLSDDNCWLILQEKAFGGRDVPEELLAVGLETAQKCKGLPLLANILGGMLYNRGRDEWISISRNILQDFDGHENYVMEVLKLSFDRLPSPASKNCFAYCSVFPKGYRMERKQLILLWMAEGFLQTNFRSNDLEMEDTGNKIFNILMQYSLLQDVEKDDYGNVSYCQMHDLMHDLAQSISRSKTIIGEEIRTNGIHLVRYLASGKSKDGIKQYLNDKAKHVRTLFLEFHISSDMVSYFTSLRVLNLSSSNMKKLSMSISKLCHLRYLDLSYTDIEALPEPISKLYNLQTLRARGCKALVEFPKEFKNLTCLRHFDYVPRDSSSSRMPSDIGCLTSLQTLLFFNVGEEKGRQIEELKHLKNLSGKLEILNLERVNGKDGAECAALFEKPNIYELRFCWGENWEGNNMDNEVLEGLQPAKSLKGLIINNFIGDQLSSWIGKLDNLMKIELRRCRRCNQVPDLGHLPFLKYLTFEELENITCISSSFYGLDNCDGSSSRLGSSQVVKKLFPSLECLILENMPKLLEWKGLERPEIASSVIVFPILEKLSIKNCPRLITIPSFTGLKELCISNCENLKQLPHDMFCFQSLEELKLYDCHNLQSIPSPTEPQRSLRGLSIRGCHGLTTIPSGFMNLRELCIYDCDNLRQLHNDFFIFQSLEKLNIEECRNLQSIPTPTGPQCSLQWLSIYNCDGLTHVPIDFHYQPPPLLALVLRACPKLISLPKGLGNLTRLRALTIGPFSDTVGLDSFKTMFDNLHQLSSSLQQLNFYGWLHWDSLPDQLQHLSALRRFYLYDFGLEALPDWFGKLVSLKALRLSRCEKLQYLPSTEAMRNLPNLRYLLIWQCPQLKEKCNQRSSHPNSEWSKISHISEIWIDDEQIQH